MFIVVQIPLCDSRAFTAEAASRLPRPEWPKPKVGKRGQFARAFGPARTRRRPADIAWADEGTYCNAARAIRFRGQIAPLALRRSDQRRPFVAFRRLLHNGIATVRVEIAVSIGGVGLRTPARTTSDLLAAIQSVLNAPCVVPQVEPINSGRTSGSDRPPPRWHITDAKPRLLADQGRALARLYAFASTAYPLDPAFQGVDAGRPVVIVEHAPQEFSDLPGFVRQINAKTVGTDCGRVAFANLDLDGEHVPLWLIEGQHPDPSGYVDLFTRRSLRLCLLRLHAEQECLDSVLRRMDGARQSNNQLVTRTDELNTYLDAATRQISRETWAGVSQSAIHAAADYAAAVTPLPEQSLRATRLDNVRIQIRRKLERYEARRHAPRQISVIKIENNNGVIDMSKVEVTVGDNAHVGNIIGKVVAGRIENAFNSFAGAQPNAELKAAVENLAKQAKTLTEKILEQGNASEEAKARAEEVAQRVEVLTQQAASKSPLKDIMKVTGQGLIDAAKAVAEMVTPITRAVTGVLTLFGL